ncbi:MAG TPA: hypothetical protein VLC49_03515 [Solirubrobacteraceae bacterium]|nr:hypothetical protein [Solirubrobacteraceae bacterium]
MRALSIAAALGATLLAAAVGCGSTTHHSAATTKHTGTGAVVTPVGLLGSDVLSRYGKIAIDYDKGLLVLDPPVS